MSLKFKYILFVVWIGVLWFSFRFLNYELRRIKTFPQIKPRKIGFVVARIGGKDGVSEEALHWMRILKTDGHEIYVFTGENENPQRLQGLAEEVYAVKECALCDHSNQDILKIAFEYQIMVPEDVLLDFIYARKDRIKTQLLDFIAQNQIDVLIVENALSLPVQIPLALALREVISETGIQVIARHHDFYWEGEREQLFRTRYPHIAVMLNELFPPDLPIVHVTINSITQENLGQRGTSSRVIPNCFSYGENIKEISELDKEEIRNLLGINPGDRIFLVPTRVVKRKNIELAVEIVEDLESMGYENLKLVVSLAVEDQEYKQQLEEVARDKGVDLIFAYDMLRGSRFSPWDIFWISDIVIIPSRWEGFGNNLLEAIAYRKPIVVYSYPVLQKDILPQGFDFITINEDNSNLNAVEEQIKLILDTISSEGHYPRGVQEAIEHNYQLAEQVFSYIQIRTMLRDILSSLP